MSSIRMDQAIEPARKRRRKDADTLATELLASRRLLSDADVLSVLSRWTFQKNKNRQNVIPDGSEFVYSDTLGLTKDRRGNIAVDAYTRDRPSVFTFLCEWLKQRKPTELVLDFPFTSISLNYNYAAKLHRDGNNAGPSLSRSLGAFTGGELSYWPNDDKRTPLDQLRTRDAVKIDTQTCYALFDGCRAHKVEPFSGGDRYSLVYFSLNAWERGPRVEMPPGTVYPTEENLRYFSELLAPPRGQGNGSILAALFGKQLKPQALFWPRANLVHLPSKLLLQVSEFADRNKKILVIANRMCSALYTDVERAHT